MKSKILIKITKENVVQEKRTITEEYITDLYVYTKTPMSDLLFRKDTNKLYTVDNIEKKLIELRRDDQQISQVNQLKSMLSTIDINQFEIGERKKYVVEGKGDAVTLNVEISTIKVDELKQTANYESYKLFQETSLFDLNLPSNEFIEHSTISLSINGNKLETTSKVIQMNIIKDNINEYDHIYAFHH